MNPMVSFLAVGDPATPSSVVTAITTAATSLQSDAVTIIGVAIGIGVVFFGAKLLWSKFKSMANG